MKAARIIFCVLWIALGGAYKAWIVASIWRWYIVPAFGVAPITILTAYGIALLVGIITMQTEGTKTTRTVTDMYVTMFAFETLTLLFAYAAHRIFA